MDSEQESSDSVTFEVANQQHHSEQEESSRDDLIDRTVLEQRLQEMKKLIDEQRQMQNELKSNFN